MNGSFDKVRERFVSSVENENVESRKNFDLAKRLKENETFFSAIQGQDEFGFWKWNVSKGKLLISDNFQRILGYSGQGNMAWNDLIHRSDYTTFLEKVSEVDVNNKKMDFVFRIWECTKNDFFWVRCFGQKTSGEGQQEDFKMMGTLLIVDELEERSRELEKIKSISNKLAKQNQQLEEFVNVVSHNLRSPIGNIQTLVSLYDLDPSEETRTFVFDQLKKVSKNMNVLVQELTDVAQIKKGSHQQREWVDLQEVFELVKENLIGNIKKSHAIVRSNFSANRKLYYSKPYIESILQNLVCNALKYASQERVPLVEVKTSIVRGEVVLEVFDNGIGIDLEKHGSEIFKLYKTFHEHKDARGEGLFITKTQVEAMGGTISVRSKVGIGTCFTVNLGE